VAHIPCVHVIPDDIIMPHYSKILGFGSFYAYFLPISRIMNFLDFFTLRVHIVQLSPTKVVAHGMTRKVHITLVTSSFPAMSSLFGTSGFGSLCTNTLHFSQILKLRFVVRSTTHNHLRIDLTLRSNFHHASYLLLVLI
jgi:hypothetical protein